MRIELNAGGLGGLVAIAEFGFSVEALDDDIDAMISSFQAVKNAVYNLEGGIGNLDEAVDSLQKRIYTEENKKHNLSDLSVRFNDFLDLAVSIDRDAAQHVRQNRDEFYRLNEHLRPVIYIEDDGWHPFRDLGEALYDLGEFIVETIVEYGDEILTVVIAVGAIAIGIIIIVGTGGAAAVVLGCAFIGCGLGAGIAGYKSYHDDGDVELFEVFKGTILGAAAGAAVGGCLVLGGSSSIWVKALGAGGRDMALDFFYQTVANDGEVGFEGYDLTKTLYTGVKSGFVSLGFGMFGQTKIFEKFISPVAQKMTTGTAGFLGKVISDEKVVNVLSNVPKYFFKSVAENGVKVIFDNSTDAYEHGLIDAQHTKESFLLDVALDVLFDTASDAVTIKHAADRLPAKNAVDTMSAKEAVGTTNEGVADDAVRARVVQNIDESKIAREASKFDAAFVEGFEVKQTVPQGVDTRFQYLSADVDPLKTPVDNFGEGVPDLERASNIKQLYKDSNITVKSHDLSAQSYNEGNNLLNVLRKDIRGTKGGVLRVVVPNGDLSIPQISALNQAWQEALEENIKLVIVPQVVLAN